MSRLALHVGAAGGGLVVTAVLFLTISIVPLLNDQLTAAVERSDTPLADVVLLTLSSTGRNRLFYVLPVIGAGIVAGYLRRERYLTIISSYALFFWIALYSSLYFFPASSLVGSG